MKKKYNEHVDKLKEQVREIEKKDYTQEENSTVKNTHSKVIIINLIKQFSS